jgi:hypothetical protein
LGTGCPRGLSVVAFRGVCLDGVDMRSKGDQSRMLWCGAGMVEEKSPDRTRAGLAICGTRVTIPPSQVLRMLGRVPTDWSCPSRRPGPPSSIWSSLSSLLGSVPARGQDGLVQACDWWARQGRALQSSTSGGPRGGGSGFHASTGRGPSGQEEAADWFWCNGCCCWPERAGSAAAC